MIVLDHLQEAVQHATNLAYVVAHAALRTNSVEFIKEIDATKISDGIEYLP